MQKNILFLTLKVFGATGGIEKVCRIAGKCIHEMSHSENGKAAIFCMHDRLDDAVGNKYFPVEIFRGFGGAKIKFISVVLAKCRLYDTVILSHVNLISVGWLIKKYAPSTRIIMFAHGIEIWGGMSKAKKRMLKCCDHIISVSHFTSQKMKQLHHIAADKCTVINNCLDPFMPPVPGKSDIREFRKTHGYQETDKILFTLSRLASNEKYKGYDKVIETIPLLKEKFPGVQYLLAGGYDDEEKAHVESLIEKLGLQGTVKIAGFIPDEKLAEYFSIADVYIMPSLQEGFGIVFIEAMYYGIPVIAGNKDGSVDALCNGRLGLLTDPLDIRAIRESIEIVLEDKSAFIPNRELLMQEFGYDNYSRKLQAVIKKVRA